MARKSSNTNSTGIGAAESIFHDEDYNLWLLLHQTRHAMAASFEKELGKHGLSLTENVILFTIQAIEHSGNARPTPAEISRWSFRKPHTISGVLNTMERKGLVKRVRDLQRKNLVRIALTEKGMAAYEQSARKMFVKGLLSSLTPEERRQLRGCLGKLRSRALRELGMEDKAPYPQLL